MKRLAFAYAIILATVVTGCVAGVAAATASVNTSHGAVEKSIKQRGYPTANPNDTVRDVDCQRVGDAGSTDFVCDIRVGDSFVWPTQFSTLTGQHVKVVATNPVQVAYCDDGDSC